MADGQHEMLLERTHPTGEEEWFCPRCGRRFLLSWPPAYAKTILEPGDEGAIHTGATGTVGESASISSTASTVNLDFALRKAVWSSSNARSTLVKRTTREESTDETEPELSDDLLRPWARLLDRPAPEHFC